MTVWRGLRGWGLIRKSAFFMPARPGRAALALDLMEELRCILADRLALTLINRRQITAAGFSAATGWGRAFAR